MRLGCCRSSRQCVVSFLRFWGLFEAGGTVVVTVVNDIDVGDGGRVGVVHGDMAVVAGMVTMWMGVFRDRSRDSVDVLAFFRSHDGSLLGSVCVTVSAVEVGAVWVLESIVTLVADSICMLSLISSLSCFISHFSRSAVLPRSSPSLSPFSYPSFNSAVFPFSSDLEIASLTMEYASSRPRAIIAS